MKSLISKELDNEIKIESLEQIKIKYMGKKGIFTSLIKDLSLLDNNNKAIVGKTLNLLKKDIEINFKVKKEFLTKKALSDKLNNEKIDISLPERQIKVGGIHPISKTMNEIISIMGAQEFSVKEGPHIEDDFYNFTALNIAEDHPARQDHDTFYFQRTGEVKKLLRTHTSPVQIRVMQNEPPPIKIIAPGSTYRCDDDSTHSPMFHQVEGLVVDKGITMANLKGVIKKLLTDFFGIEDLPMRFRPSYFPFTEPSAEVDIGCSIKKGKLTIGEGSDWLEVMGCGMVHPSVFKNCGIDNKKFSGFAFGLGLERFAMLKYGITDLRMFYENDLRWLKHYNFSAAGFPSLLRGLL
ncbi:phenylalanine--tRNA ligase subunit alpha [Alphaproteobacteria bacterium]|nr:phenylalanine--tRNA ligase subunit alpha [Alphaproteobacteria bacterium]